MTYLRDSGNRANLAETGAGVQIGNEKAFSYGDGMPVCLPRVLHDACRRSGDETL